MATTLHLVRHAHTEANDLGASATLSGWFDVPLSERGRLQLEALAARFGEETDGWPIYSSTSVRARDTATAIARGRPVRFLRSLREISCGMLDGWPLAEVRGMYPRLWEENQQQTNEHFAWPGGESYAQLRRRAVGVLRGIAARHPDQSVIVVTHAGIVSQAIGHIRGLSPAAWEPWRPGNGSVTTIDCGSTAELVVFDDRSHLDSVRNGSEHPRGGRL